MKQHIVRYLIIFILLFFTSLLHGQSVYLGSNRGADLGKVRKGGSIKIIVTACVGNGHSWESYHGNTRRTIIGPDTGSFQIDQSGLFLMYCSSLTPLAGFDTVFTTFHPQSSGNYISSVIIDDVKSFSGSPASTGIYTFTAEVIDTIPGGYIMAYPEQLNFDTVMVGNSVKQYLSISNRYLSSDTVTITIKADALKKFTVEKELFAVVLEPGDYKTFSIDFLPTDTGLFTDTLIITSDASQTKKPIYVPLSGFARRPVSAVLSSQQFSPVFSLTNHSVILFSNFSQPEYAFLELYDALGRQLPMPNSQIQIPSGTSSQKLDVGNLSSGCYLLRMKMKDQIISKSFVITR